MQLPIDSNGRLKLISARLAIAPFTYRNGLKLDAYGRVVVVG